MTGPLDAGGPWRLPGEVVSPASGESSPEAGRVQKTWTWISSGGGRVPLLQWLGYSPAVSFSLPQAPGHKATALLRRTAFRGPETTH